MSIFQKEADFIREMAYQNFLVYCKLWQEIARLYMDSDEDVNCPEAQHAYIRAMNQKTLADFLDPQGRYNFYTRYRNERNNRID